MDLPCSLKLHEWVIVDPYQHPNSFNSNNQRKDFIKIDTFLFVVSLSYYPNLISNYMPFFIHLVSKHPFSTNYKMIFGFSNKCPYFISLKLIKFFLHSKNATFIILNFLKCLRFKLRDKSNIIKVLPQLNSSHHPLWRTIKNVILWFATLLDSVIAHFLHSFELHFDHNYMLEESHLLYQLEILLHQLEILLLA